MRLLVDDDSTVLMSRVGESKAARVNGERINQALGMKVNLEFVDTPLDEVMRAISSVFNVPIVLDRHNLDDYGIGTDLPVTASFQGISCRTASNLILKENDMTMVVDSEWCVLPLQMLWSPN